MNAAARTNKKTDDGHHADCLFCNIIKGAIPSDRVYEDEAVFAFRDIHPKAPTHVLVVPRQHVATLTDADDPALLGTLMTRVRTIADEVLGLDKGYRVIINVRSGGGQEVYHLHVHILGGKILPF